MIIPNEANSNITIQKATADDSHEISIMLGDLLSEINTIGIHAFNFDHKKTTDRLKDSIDREIYFVFVARKSNGSPVGFLSLYESYAIYAGGSFGTIAELYVRQECRSKNIGLHLISEAKDFGRLRGWTQLEVTTPPLPQFDRTLAFYEREGFFITGGRKLKMAI